MAKQNHPATPQGLVIKGVWYDKVADECYELLTDNPLDPNLTPSLHLLGDWLSAAGFAIGQKVHIKISPEMITLTRCS